jgi:hypothetical protein
MVMATSSNKLCGDAHAVLLMLNVSKIMFQEWQTIIGCYQRMACA